MPSLNFSPGKTAGSEDHQLLIGRAVSYPNFSAPGHGCSGNPGAAEVSWVTEACPEPEIPGEVLEADGNVVSHEKSRAPERETWGLRGVEWQEM